MNTEFKFDTSLIGFEFYVSVAGSLYIQLRSFNTICGPKILCSDTFGQSLTLPTFQSYDTWTYTVTQGYNQIFLLKPIPVRKGWFIYLDLFNYLTKIELDPVESYYSDYFLSGTVLSRMNRYKNNRLYFNTITEQSYYESLVFYPYKFQNTGVFNITVRNLNSTDTSNSLLFNVVTCKNLITFFSFKVKIF